MKLLLYTVFVLLFLDSCNVQKSNGQIKENLVFAKIDSASLAQIKQEKKLNQSIFTYYKTEIDDEVVIWSDKMFGRCCTEADLLYSELLSFDISANINNPTYPYSNLSDTKYRTAYAFKEKQGVEIYLKLNRKSEYHSYHTKLSVDEVLKPNDTILNPFKLSLVNGYTKSKEVFKQNGRIKTMKIFLNEKYRGTVLLQDTPLVQCFELDILFTRNDIIKLIPINYYKGTKYDDICISEIQSNLGTIAFSSLNKKYVINELLKNKNTR